MLHRIFEKSISLIMVAAMAVGIVQWQGGQKVVKADAQAPIRLNIGGLASGQSYAAPVDLTDPNTGAFWKASPNFGSNGMDFRYDTMETFLGKYPIIKPITAQFGANDYAPDSVYYYLRYAQAGNTLSFNITNLEASNYKVRLHFYGARNWGGGPLQNVPYDAINLTWQEFDILINSTEVYSEFNLAAEAEALVPGEKSNVVIIKEFEAQAVGGSMAIDLVPTAGSGVYVSAIELLPIVGAALPTSEPTTPQPTPNSSEILRINGGAYPVIENGTTWLLQDSFIESYTGSLLTFDNWHGDITVNKPLNGVSYAPDTVYRSIVYGEKGDTVKFVIDDGLVLGAYDVRLHFYSANPWYAVNVGDVVFGAKINNQWAFTNFSPIQGVAIIKEHRVENVNGSITIEMIPADGNKHYYLSGIEIIPVAGWTPAPSTEPTASPTQAPSMITPSDLFINQAYGGTDDGAVSHGFIELYNFSNSTISLDNYSLQIIKGSEQGKAHGTNWDVLPLTGESIPARSSFLIRATEKFSSGARYTIADADIDWNITISNRAFSVALVSNQTPLSGVLTQGEFSNLIDLVGAINDSGANDAVNNYSGVFFEGITKQKTIRRIQFRNTGNNRVDFEVLDYRTSGLNNTELDEMKPRYSGDGPWGENINPPIFVPDDQKLVFSKEAGIYSSSFSLALTTGYANGTIRYTLNGSDPTASSTAYSTPIPIANRTNDANYLGNKYTYGTICDYGNSLFPYNTPQGNYKKGTVIKAQVFASDGSALSDVYTKSYFVGLDYGDLAVVSIATDEANLFDYNTGIYLQRNCFNKGSDWERPAHVELFEPDGSLGFEQNLGVRINGAYARNYAQKSLRFYAKSGYSGTSYVNYDIFDGAAKDVYGDEITSFRRFILRNSGNDNHYARVRDTVLHKLADGLNTPIQAYRGVAAFINGEFWGVYDARERVDEYFINDKYKLGNSDKVMVFEFPMGVNNVPDDYFLEPGVPDPLMVDDYTLYLEMWNWFNQNPDLSSPALYEKAQSFIDLDNFIDVYAINTIIGNWDWPGNNNMIWRYKNETYPEVGSTPTPKDGRWRYILKDLDCGYHSDFFTYTSNYLDMLFTGDVFGQDGYTDLKTTLIFRRLFTNRDFVEKFYNRICDLTNSNYKSSVIVSEINKNYNLISSVMYEQVARWGSPTSWNQWDYNINSFKNGVNSRPAYLYSHMQQRGSMMFSNFIGNIVDLTLTTPDSAKGYVRINDVDIIDGTWGVTNSTSWTGKYFQKLKQTITAVPKAGYEFEKFVVNGMPFNQNPLILTVSANATIQALFVEKSGDPLPNIIINQVYGGTDGIISHGFVELYNPTETAISLDEFSVQVSTGTEQGVATSGDWNVLPLTGKAIEAHGSFLIRATARVSPSPRYVIERYDVDWNIAISNRALSVALVANQTALTPIITAGELDNVIDLVGATNTASGKNPDVVFNFFGAPVDGISKQKTIRRIDFANTRNNLDDFEILDYREPAMSDAELEEVKPRWSGSGYLPSDINRDGQTDSADLSILLEKYGRTGTIFDGWFVDINQDGCVDNADLAMLLDEYGR